MALQNRALRFFPASAYRALQRLADYIGKSCLDLLFPQSCLHCGALQSAGYLCSYCASYLEMIPLEGRCAICFHLHCRQKCSLLGLASRACLFDAAGPAMSLKLAYQSGKFPLLATTFSSFIIWQCHLLQWPDFDFVLCKEEKKLPAIAKKLAASWRIPLLLDVPFVEWQSEKKARFLQNKTILYLQHRLQTMEACAMSYKLSPYQSKNIYVLSLFR